MYNAGVVVLAVHKRLKISRTFDGSTSSNLVTRTNYEDILMAIVSQQSIDNLKQLRDNAKNSSDYRSGYSLSLIHI